MKSRASRTGAWLRPKAALSVLVAAATAAGLAAFGSAGTARAATGPAQWHLAYRGHAAGLDDVTAVSAADAWAVGVAGTPSTGHPQFMHWDGKAWSVYNISGITKFRPTSVKASAPNNVWAFGYNDAQVDDNPFAVIYHGSNEVTALKLPAGWQVGHEAVLSPTSVWGESNQGCSIAGSSVCTVLWHWNGTKWTSAAVPGQVESVTAVGGHVFFLALTGVKFPANDGLASFGIGRPVIYEPTTKVYPLAGPDLQVDGTSAGLVVELNGQRYLAAHLTSGSQPWRFWHWNGKAWTTIAEPSGIVDGGGATSDNAQGFWSGASAHWTGTQWVNADTFASSLATAEVFIHAVAPVPGTSDVWGVGAVAASGQPVSAASTMVAVYGALP
jgi:hypothetical protein